ncbi:hypothetical protein K488DRAFT_86677 [Vararia minispora EC-137]|uniref:Uncharacterized protein n=1 Tax=Vararia minispora EC-137 TaxID=1314806 RepID=A0ACB8QJ40_9AGAM|nr:hypothetical protein K488DRAFT_86677 [Vararia minispora EC-137]
MHLVFTPRGGLSRCSDLPPVLDHHSADGAFSTPRVFSSFGLYLPLVGFLSIFRVFARLFLMSYQAGWRKLHTSPLSSVDIFNPSDEGCAIRARDNPYLQLHILSAPEAISHPLFGLVCVADIDDIFSVMASASYQRQVLGVAEQPVVGLAFDPLGFDIQLMLGRFDDDYSTSQEYCLPLPRIVVPEDRSLDASGYVDRPTYAYVYAGQGSLMNVLFSGLVKTKYPRRSASIFVAANVDEKDQNDKPIKAMDYWLLERHMFTHSYFPPEVTPNARDMSPWLLKLFEKCATYGRYTRFYGLGSTEGTASEPNQPAFEHDCEVFTLSDPDENLSWLEEFLTDLGITSAIRLAVLPIRRCVSIDTSKRHSVGESAWRAPWDLIHRTIITELSSRGLILPMEYM